MDRKPLIQRKTGISYKTEEKTVLRGYDVRELANAGYTFIDGLYILFQGRIPAENERAMLDYEVAEFLEHSMSPSAAAAIGVMNGHPMLPAAVGASIATFGGGAKGLEPSISGLTGRRDKPASPRPLLTNKNISIIQSWCQ